MLRIPLQKKSGKHTPQGLITGKPVSQKTSYSAMFGPLYSNISKEQYVKYSISAIHPGIMENMVDLLVKYVPHISICENHTKCLSFSNFELCLITL